MSEKYCVFMKYSWGDVESPYGEYEEEYDAIKAMCHMVAEEAFVCTYENGSDGDKATAYFDPLNRTAELHYADDEICYYEVMTLEEAEELYDEIMEFIVEYEDCEDDF